MVLVLAGCLVIARVARHVIFSGDDWTISLVGVYLDQGTTRTTVRRSSFAGQTWAAIGDYRGIGNAVYENDYEDPKPVRHEHLASARQG